MISDQLMNKIVELLDSLEGCHVLAVQAAIQSMSENDLSFETWSASFSEEHDLFPWDISVRRQVYAILWCYC